MIDSLLGLYNSLIDTLSGIVGTLVDTTEHINDVAFTDNAFYDYLGYAKYAMGSTLYVTFFGFVSLVIGIQVFSWFKGALEDIWTFFKVW